MSNYLRYVLVLFAVVGTGLGVIAAFWLFVGFAGWVLLLLAESWSRHSDAEFAVWGVGTVAVLLCIAAIWCFLDQRKTTSEEEAG